MLFLRSMTMCAGFPRLRQRHRMPAAAPSASRSAMRWPMMKTWLDCAMSSDSDPATTRDFTRVCRSVSFVRPP